MQQNFISVVVTTYNSTNTVVRTLKSIVEQLGINDELLIYDDSSKDDTVQVIKEYLQDKPVNYKLQVGTYNCGGPAKGRNWGIKNSTGQYICFCDADDEWLLGKLTIQVEFLNAGNYDFCGTRCFVVGSKQYPEFEGEVSLYSQLVRNKFSLSTLMFKAACFKAHGVLFDEGRCYHAVEDYELILRLYVKGHRGFVINSNLVNYFHTATSLSHVDIKKSELKRLLVLKNFKSAYLHQLLFVRFISFILKTRIKYNELRDYISKF
jgi:glycosyltransferase involved in cell wall biosynthesis